MTRVEKSLYIHIPFCASRCFYCDFVSSAGLSRAWQERYARALIRELELYDKTRGVRDDENHDGSWDTVYIGGGTPTYLDEDILEGIIIGLGLAKTRASGRPGVPNEPRPREFTVEANPGTLSVSKLDTLRRMGCDRLSIGAQSFDDRYLASLGRRHSAADFSLAWALAREAGFANMSLDLMYGLSGQSLDHWRETLAKAIALAPEHISLYQLNIEPGTELARLTDIGSYKAADEENCGEQYSLAHDMLTGAGYDHYEISNYARPGYESRHNLRYWRNERYIGLGAGASGYIAAREEQPLGDKANGIIGFRYTNKPDILDYMTAVENREKPVAMSEEITPSLAMAEELMLAFRLREGVSLTSFYDRWGINLSDKYGSAIKNCLKAGLVEYNETCREGRDTIRLGPTIEGWLQYNTWIQEFI